MFNQTKKLWDHLPRRRHKQFWFLLLLMLFSSLMEIVSLGSILPFLGVLTSPDVVYNHEYIKPFVVFFNVERSSDLIFPLTLLFIVAAVLAGITRATLLYVMTRFSFAAGADMSIDIYQRTLYQAYEIHVNRSSSEIINGVITKTNTVVGGVFSSSLVLLNSSILIIAIITTLLSINVLIAISAFFGFGVIYWIVIRYTRRQLNENSKSIADKSTLMIKALQEGLGGIRDILIDGNQQFYCKIYRNADGLFRRASANNVFIGGSPKFLMETVGMVLIAILAYVMSQTEGGLVSDLPILGVLALGAQRLLPALQQAYKSYSSIKGAQYSFTDVLDLLDQPLPKYASQPKSKPILFNSTIYLKSISYRYAKESPAVLDNIDLKIKKGERIGIVGKTGSGKSTLLDVFMGLLQPTEGAIFVDDKIINEENNRSWQAHIAHVPQNIYLADASIEENIAFGVANSSIDHKLVEKVAKEAQLFGLIESWQDKYKTYVGENGVRLSGGQRQRIGIARALYKKADVLIFDEATSALDNKTELAVMEEIENLGENLTILIIAHRITTLRLCDRIIEVSNSGVSAKKYDELK